MSKIYDVLIIGGGIGGLGTLHYLKRNGKDVILLEKSESPGGLVKTNFENDYLLETGPNAFLKSYKNTYDFVLDIGLENEIIYNLPEAYHRYIYRNNQIHPLPEDPISFFKSDLLTLKAKLRLFFEPFIGRGPDEETIRDFGKRRFGVEVADIILDAMIKGICTGDISKLDINSMFPRLKNIEKDYRSLLLFLLLFKKKNVKKTKDGKKVLFLSLKKGMGDISNQVKKLYSKYVKHSTEVSKVNKLEHHYEIITGNETYLAKKIVLATQACDSKNLIMDAHPKLASILGKISYADVGTVTMSFKKEDVCHPLDGFGFLAPSNQNLDILGALFSSSLFPGRAPKGEKMIKVYLGGPERQDIYNLEIDQMIALVEKNIRPILDVRGKYVFAKGKKIKNAIPLFNMGHKQIKKDLDDCVKDIGSVFLVGNYMDGISVDATLKKALDISNKLI